MEWKASSAAPCRGRIKKKEGSPHVNARASPSRDDRGTLPKSSATSCRRLSANPSVVTVEIFRDCGLSESNENKRTRQKWSDGDEQRFPSDHISEKGDAFGDPNVLGSECVRIPLKTNLLQRRQLHTGMSATQGKRKK
ncbi:hypothetical protein EYF80_024692 [Liparis tanakae]|uniref:Uncharacterized protein n=1 Tax=Liparis tanakae TaxID=230148 RepID=A0A4Z2HJG6_9TELE|nr:hypothetical protein EYF80_024692 [Liparis tanakae]